MEGKNKRNKKLKLYSQQTGPGIILESAPRNMILCLFFFSFFFFSETKWQTFRGIPGFYSTSGAVIFCSHLVPVKCKVFTTTSTREIQLCARPTTQLTCSPLLLADFTCQSIAHARKSKWKGSIVVLHFVNDVYFSVSFICVLLCSERKITLTDK